MAELYSIFAEKVEEAAKIEEESLKHKIDDNEDTILVNIDIDQQIEEEEPLIKVKEKPDKIGVEEQPAQIEVEQEENEPTKIEIEQEEDEPPLVKIEEPAAVRRQEPIVKIERIDAPLL